MYSLFFYWQCCKNKGSHPVASFLLFCSVYFFKCWSCRNEQQMLSVRMSFPSVLTGDVRVEQQQCSHPPRQYPGVMWISKMATLLPALAPVPPWITICSQRDENIQRSESSRFNATKWNHACRVFLDALTESGVRRPGRRRTLTVCLCDEGPTHDGGLAPHHPGPGQSTGLCLGSQRKHQLCVYATIKALRIGLILDRRVEPGCRKFCCSSRGFWFYSSIKIQ